MDGIRTYHVSPVIRVLEQPLPFGTVFLRRRKGFYLNDVLCRWIPRRRKYNSFFRILASTRFSRRLMKAAGLL